MLPQPAWRELRETQPIPVAVETTCKTYLEQRRDEVHQAMAKVSGLLTNDQLPDVRLRHGHLTITPLRTTVPPEAEELGRRAYELLRWVRITDLLVEVDELTGMSRHFTHLHTGEPVKDVRALYTVLLAEATNLGLAKMAQACPEYTYRQLAWIADWYVRDETCRHGLASIINTQHRHSFAAHWGDGTTSVLGPPIVPRGWAECVDWPGQPPLRARAGREALYPSFRPVRSISHDHDQRDGV